MKKTMIALVLIGALGNSANAIADNTLAVEAERTSYAARQTAINNGVAVLENVRAAVLAAFMANNSNAWPASTDALVATGYTSNVTSAWGNKVQGAVTGGGNSFTLNLEAPLPEVATGIAGRLGAAVNGNVIALTIPVPATASIMDNGLMRFAVAGRPELNQMGTNLDMNGFDLLNVSSATINTVNGGTGTFDNIIVNDSLQVLSDATFNKDVTINGKLNVNEIEATKVTANEGEFQLLKSQSLIVDGAQVNGTLNTVDVYASGIVDAPVVNTAELNAESIKFTQTLEGGSAKLDTASISTLNAGDTYIEGLLKVTGPSEFVGDARFANNVLIDGSLTVAQVATMNEIIEGGVYLKDKYLGIDDSAKDAQMLGGVIADSYARKDVANVWSNVQTFASGVITEGLVVNGASTLNGKVIANSGVDVNGGNVAVNSSYDVKVGSISMKDLYNRVRSLEENYSDGGGSTPSTPTGWQTVYSGSGTTSYSISGTYSSFRGTMTYKDYDGVSYSKSISGAYGGGVSVSDSASTISNCSASTSATLSFAISSGWSFNGTTGINSDSCTYYVGDKGTKRTTTVYAQIKEAKITSLEVYR